MVAHGFDYDRHRRAFVLSQQHFDDVLTSRSVSDALTEHGLGRPRRAAAAGGAPPRPRRCRPWSRAGSTGACAVVSDGMGEVESLSVFRFRGCELEKLHSQPIAASLGILYAIGTRFLGFQFNSDEYKVMGLAPYGDPERFRSGLPQARPLRRRPRLGRRRLAAGRARRRRAGLPARPRAARGADLHPDGRPTGRSSATRPTSPPRCRSCLTELLVALVGHWLERTGERIAVPGRRHLPQLQVQPGRRGVARRGRDVRPAGLR